MSAPTRIPATFAECIMIGLSGIAGAIKCRAEYLFPEFFPAARRAKRIKRAKAAATEFAVNTHALDYLRALQRTMPGFPPRALALASLEYDNTVEVFISAGNLLYLHSDSTLIDRQKIGSPPPRALHAVERFAIASS